MLEHLITALIGFVAGIIPAVITYLAKQKELSSPVNVLEKVTKAEEALRDDLLKQIEFLKQEVKELKQENKELRESEEKLKQSNIALTARVAHLEILLAEQGGT